MREIKFRGYAVTRMVGSQWLYGFGLDPIEYTEEYAKEIGRKEDWYLYTDDGPIHVYKKSIGQYTGLKDKNGKEIYEGDIIKCYSKELAFVTFKSNSFGLETKLYGFEPFLNVYGYCTVIGNIYENKSLLEGESND